MIPLSAIRDVSLHEVVHELPLCRDVAEHILSFTDKFVVFKNDPDLFWYTLGQETCNLYRWNHYACMYACHAFGKSSKIAKHVDMYSIFINLMGDLDRLLCAYFDIESDEENAFRKRFYNIPITNVFYNNRTIQDPPKPGKRFKKYFEEYEQVYITTFLSRFKEYLENVEVFIGDIPYEARSGMVHDVRKRIRTTTKLAHKKMLKIDLKEHVVC
jgi:hypothetical protein